MKNILKLFGSILLLTFLLISCTKKQQPSLRQAEKFKFVKSIEDERLLFTLLTTQEKTELAIEHLDFCASYYNFSEIQLASIETIKSYLPTVYSSSEPENAIETTSIQLDINQFFSNLSNEQRRVTFNSMVVDEEGVLEFIANTGSNSNDLSSCNCNPSSNYCSLSDWGPSILCDKTVKCGYSSWGCGTLFIYSCKGKCNLFS